MTEETADPTLRQLRRLRVHEPDRARAEQVRVRCRAALARRRSRSMEDARRDRARLRLGPALLGGLFCAGYLFAMILDVFSLYVDH